MELTNERLEALDSLIENVELELSQTEVATKEYFDILDALEHLHKIRKEEIESLIKVDEMKMKANVEEQKLKDEKVKTITLEEYNRRQQKLALLGSLVSLGGIVAKLGTDIYVSKAAEHRFDECIELEYIQGEITRSPSLRNLSSNGSNCFRK